MSDQHLQAAPRSGDNSAIPAPVTRSPQLAPPKAGQKPETYSVTVYRAPLQSLLFALARDAKLNIDIHPSIQGEVTLNALDQSLPQLLKRIAQQVDMRYELQGNNLLILPDAPFLKHYKIDYVNISRNTSSTVSIATQISTPGASGAAGSGGNTSTTSVNNTSNNRFWETLVQNIKDVLRETDKLVSDEKAAPAPAAASAPPSAATPGGTLAALSGANQSAPQSPPAAPAGASTGPVFREAASVIANPETGLITVRATGRQHEKIAEFLDLVQTSAKRQVLIEATIIEVKLSENFQQGINWSRVANANSSGATFTQGQIGTNTLPSGVTPGVTPGVFLMNWIRPNTAIGDLTATLQLLESFGKVKVLSSPKISVLNNQTAILKVVDNSVYFTITATVTPGSNGSAAISTYTSQLNTVPVGLVMSVTPQIAENDEVTLNVRPTITRIVGYVQDPNPALATSNVTSKVPVVQAREMESVLKVSNGQTAVMGGLMQDAVENQRDAVPTLGQLPVIGNLFAYRNENSSKTELVIFMRPVVVKEASIQGDYRNMQRLLQESTPQATGGKT
ncbi:pilus (MSHA type) biogenesis protein MshL [Massilia sp. W12]|uniref:pilus (MSHA type) biogenesis protein MshL n=1 Tax=Massilia sp. W12 TaxID=3126507 RepID=UPI0030D2EF55